MSTIPIVRGFCSQLLFLGDKKFWMLVLCGSCALFLDRPLPPPSTWYLLLSALAEEYIFRSCLQEVIKQHAWGRKKIGPVTRANLLSSSLFSLAHTWGHSPLWAATTLIPSLAFGWCWDRYQRILPCWLLHFFYNLLYFRPFS